MDSLNGFIVFVQVAETRSFVAAGRLLGVSASAVGKRVARLEERLGVRLFHRSTRSITLTAEGTLFLARSRRVLAEIEAAEQELSNATGAPRGRLRVSLPLISALMLPLLADFMRAYPAIELDLDFTDRMVDVIEEGFDAVVRTGEPSIRGSRRDGSAPFLHCWSRRRTIWRAAATQVPADLARHACLHYRYPNTGKLEVWPLLLDTDGTEWRLPTSMVCNNIETRLCFAVRGLGIACLPAFSAQEDLAAGRLRTVLGAHMLPRLVDFQVLWPSGRHLTPRLRVFIDFLTTRTSGAASHSRSD